jgi:fructose-bisphosphate aldolase class II
MLISPKTMFEKCYGQYAVAAINVFTLEQVLGVFRAAKSAASPVIIQTTPVARKYAEPEVLLGMIQAVASLYPEVIYAVHLDHGNEEHINDALLKGGYSSVMIDASHDSIDENIRRTRSVVEHAHKKGCVVEAELGVLSGVEDDLDIDASHARYTQPDEVVHFVNKTGCDSLAIAVGTSHGAYKFSGKQGIQFDILKEIQQRMPGFPLVLHGGSAVDPAEIARINAHGGKMKEGSRGVSDEEISSAIQYGICKINVATDLRVLWARVHREFFFNSPDLFDPVIPGGIYTEELEKFCIEKFEKLGSAGKAGAFKNDSI